MIPPSSSPPAAKSGCAAAIRGSIAPTSPTSTPTAATSCRCAARADRTLGSALYSDRSQIALRMLTYGERAGRSRRSCAARLEAAIAFRESLGIDATAYRLVHGEADLLPSLIVDRYGDYLVVQALSQGMDRLLPAVVAALNELLQPRGILARNDPQRARARRARAARRGAAPARCRRRSTVAEGGIEYDVDLRRGQKTGLFLDQRENRAAAARYARGRLLDCFSYHGGFALTLARRCTRDDRVRHLRGRRRADHARTRRATASPSTRASATCSTSCAASSGSASGSTRSCSTRRRSPRTRRRSPKATAGYKEINLRALKLLKPGGTLVTCSCSYNVNEAMFAEIVYDAAVDAQAHVDGRREADAGARSSGAARRAGDLLPEVLHPAEAVAQGREDRRCHRAARGELR